MKIESYKQIRPQATQDMDNQIRDAAKMYEKHFLNEMVKAMRSTVDRTDQPSMAENIYSSQLDQQYVDKWSERGGIGLADIIHGQLKERFFPDKNIIQQPSGPLPLNKGVRIKVDDTKPMGIPILESGTADQKKDLSYLFEAESSKEKRPVTTPWAGQITQMIRQDDRQLVRLAHDNGLASTISFRGSAQDFSRGDRLSAGDTLGTMSPEATGLTWKVENGA